MKKIFLLLLLIAPFVLSAQTHSCCKPSSTEMFAGFASNAVFASSHLSPAPLDYTVHNGQQIKFATSDSVSANAFVIRPEAPSENWLFVFHEWWGLNDYIRREAENLFHKFENVNVLAIDLYDGTVASNPEEAQKAMQGLKDARAQSIIKGALKYAGANAKVTTIGWCMGGGWALQAAIMAGKNGNGCVMYYGMPETDISKLRMIQGDVLGLFASRDQYITPQIVETFEKNMKTAGKNLAVQSFDADHAFANPSNPKYDSEATTAANARAYSFLRERLK